MKILSLLFLIIIGQCFPVLSEDFPKKYLCKRTDKIIMIDGKLDENIWKQLPEMGNFTVVGKCSKPVYPTRAWICYDDKNLYVAFESISEDIWATMTKHDEYLYEEDVVEIFIDPDGDGKNYVEIEINPLNTVLDMLVNDTKISWHAVGLAHTVKIYGTLNLQKDMDKRWVVEMAIPFKNFKYLGANNIPPKKGDVWRLNLYRIERGKQFRSIPELTVWSPIKREGPGCFHTPQQFGYIVFEGK